PGAARDLGAAERHAVLESRGRPGAHVLSGRAGRRGVPRDPTGRGGAPRYRRRGRRDPRPRRDRERALSLSPRREARALAARASVARCVVAGRTDTLEAPALRTPCARSRRTPCESGREHPASTTRPLIVRFVAKLRCA